MARVPLIDYDAAGPEVRALYEQLGNPERMLNVTKLVANHPALLSGFVTLLQALYQHNTLAPRLRELAYLRTSQINQCHY
jgi:alkylhydroperoxidase family enzyme